MIINDKESYTAMMAKLIEALGYTDIKQAEQDSVVNMLAKKDGKVYAFACRYDIDAIKGSVMEEFINSANRSGIDGLVFMTNSSFSSSAKKAADAAGVELWDRNHIDRIAIGIDEKLEEPVVKEERHRAVFIAVAVAAVILAAALALYFNPSILSFLKK